MEFDSVLAIVSWPIRVSKESGLYFLADTIYSLIDYKDTKKSAVYSSGVITEGHLQSLSNEDVILKSLGL